MVLNFFTWSKRNSYVHPCKVTGKKNFIRDNNKSNKKDAINYIIISN